MKSVFAYYKRFVMVLCVICKVAKTLSRTKDPDRPPKDQRKEV